MNRPAVAFVLAFSACGQTHVGEPDAGIRRDAATDAGPPDAGLDAGPADAGLPDSGLDAGPPVHAQAYVFCVEMSELRCRGTEVCCGLPDRVDFLAWNAGCGVYIESQCEAWASDTALRDGTLRWNETEAQTLIDDLRTALATCGAISRPFDVSAVFEGTLAEGEDCTPDLPYSRSVGIFRCRGDLRCDLIGHEDPGMFTGTCVPRRGEGDRCNYDCQAGLWCDGTLGVGGDPFMGHCAREEQTRCGRDLWCRSRFCDIPMRQCVEPEPRLTWCGYIG